MKTLYFGGGGFAIAYHIGVVRALQEKMGNDFYKNYEIHGDSAGTLVALSIMCGYDWINMKNLFYDYVKTCKKEGIWFGNISTVQDKYFDILLDNKTLEDINNFNLYVGTTEYPYKHIRCCKYDSIKQFRQYLHETMYIPGLIRFNPNSRLDGAMSNNITYNISIGSQNSAHMKGKWRWYDVIYPLSNQRMDKLMYCGYEDGINFLSGNICNPNPNKYRYSFMTFLWFIQALLKLINIFM